MESVRYKFRALDAATKKWVYGYYVVLDSGFELVECIWELGAKRARPIDPDTLGQFTGLTDVNGVEIYEGDIVKADSEYGESVRDIVCWSYGSFYVANHTFKQLNNVKIIGNIYQNKDLLKEKN